MKMTSQLKGWRISGSNPFAYQLTKDYRVFQTGHNSGCFSVKDIVGKEDFGVMLQGFKANNYKEKRLKLSCVLKTENVIKCNIWMQANDKLDDVIQFDNMDDRTIQGTTDWGRYSIVLDVPVESEFIYFGIYLKGFKGKVWIDNFYLEEIDEKVLETSISEIDKLPKKPINLGFIEQE